MLKFIYLEFSRNPNRNRIIIEDTETINQLADFLKQYQVKPSKQDGWISKNLNEQIDFLFEYKDGSTKPYTFDGDVIASYSIYMVVNDSIDYEWMEKLFLD